jgi:hypothetical protein
MYNDFGGLVLCFCSEQERVRLQPSSGMTPAFTLVRRETAENLRRSRTWLAGDEEFGSSGPAGAGLMGCFVA